MQNESFSYLFFGDYSKILRIILKKLVFLRRSVIKKIIIFICIFNFSAFSKNKLNIPENLYKAVPFSSEYIEDGALIRNIEYTVVKKLLEKINKLEGLSLKSRGEAHITVITPPEAKGWFSDHKGINYLISSLELHEKYFKTLQNTRFEPICIGKQQNEKGDKVYYIVVKSQDLLNIRQDIYRELKQRSSFTNKKVSFIPDKYDPHITIGFIGNDVHGVSKGADTCVYYFNK